jgi:MFS family permease
MFGQSMTLYFSIWYLKGEIAKRVSLFIGAGVVAGSLGGLIAFGVSSINHSSIDKWRVSPSVTCLPIILTFLPVVQILFLIEGLPSLVLAIVVFLFLPSRPQVSRYLNEDERTVCITRLNRENNHEVNAGIDWRGVRRAFTDWKVYVLAVMYR